MASGVCWRGAVVPKICLAIVAGISCADFAVGQQLQKARVTQVVQDVKLLPKEAAARPALVNDEVNPGTAVRTGTDSRSELTFTDLTITRLGANTVFSFNRQTRELKVSSGAALIQIPPEAAEVKASNALVTAAISGGTAIFDSATGKFMVLEGKGRMWALGHPEQALTIPAGNMVWLTPSGHISPPKTFDVKLVLKTSRLITRFPKLANLDLILKVIEEQQALTGPTPPVPVVQEIISQKVAATTISETAPPPPPPPPPPPGDFGSPQTILLPAPYPIDSGAVISTDPTITRNGVTDFGTIYRTQTQDGPLGAWAFGSTSAFDIASGFSADGHPSLENVAVFKFQLLELNGPPTISTEGGATRLGLIGVDGITSSGAGGTFNFPSLDSVFLATQNGPINLGPGITFQGMNHLLLYARGPAGNMTLSSQFDDIGALNLNAEGTITVNGAAISHNGGNISLLSGVTSGMAIDLQSNSKLFSLGHGGTISILTNGGDITANGQIEADGGTINISNFVPSGSAQNSLLQLSAAAPIIVLGGSLTADSINVSSAGDLNIGTSGPVSIDAVTMTLQAARNLTWGGSVFLSATNTDISAGADITVNGPMSLNTEVASDLSTGGNITVSSANGKLSAQSIQARIKVDPSVTVTSGANISFNSSGDIKTTSESTDDGISLGVDTSGGGTISNGGGVSMIAGGNVTTSGDLALSIDNGNGGRIGSNAVISLTAANVTAGSFSEIINNPTGGVIGGNASIVLNLTGDLTSTGGDTIRFQILNYGNTAGFSGGNIGGSAITSVTAANITGDSLVVDMDGEHGVILASAAITFNISGTVKTTRYVDFHIEQAEAISGPGAPPSSITLNGGNYEAGGLFNGFINSRDGTIVLNAANLHADIVRIGAFGSDGSLKIGGGLINANTLLKLYAPGSNGVIDFVANVTLNSQGRAAVIAANSVTIENNVVVTITGAGGPALIYTNHPNYSGSGGNGSTTGIFAGNGATTAGPLSAAPGFYEGSPQSLAGGTNDSTSTQEAPGPQTRPLKSRGTRFPGSRQSTANHGHRSTVFPRMALRIADSTALSEVIADTASKDFSLAKHARSKSGQASRDQTGTSRDRSRRDDSRRTLSSSRKRMASEPAHLANR